MKLQPAVDTGQTAVRLEVLAVQQHGDFLELRFVDFAAVVRDVEVQIPLTLFRPERYGQAGAPRQSVLDGVFHEGLKNILRRKTVQYALFEGLDLQRQLVHISKTLNVHVRPNVFQLGFESGHRIAAIERGSEHAHSAFEHFDSVRRIVLFQKKADGGEDIEQKMWRKLAFDGHQLQIDAGFLLSQQLQFSVFQIFLLFVQRNDEGMDVVGQQIDFDNSGFLPNRPAKCSANRECV